MSPILEIFIDTIFFSILYVSLLSWDLLSHMAQETELLVPQSIPAAEPVLLPGLTQNWVLPMSLNEVRIFPNIELIALKT